MTLTLRGDFQIAERSRPSERMLLSSLPDEMLVAVLAKLPAASLARFAACRRDLQWYITYAAFQRAKELGEPLPLSLVSLPALQFAEKAAASTVLVPPQPAFTTKRVVQISGAHNHVLYLTECGRIFSKGDNWCGQCGRPNESSHSRNDCPLGEAPQGDLRFSVLSAGYRHNLAVTDDGDLYAWGSCETGCLGIDPAMIRAVAPPLTYAEAGHRDVVVTWRAIKLPMPSKTRFAFAGYAHSFAFTADGSLFVWGRNGEQGAFGAGRGAGTVQGYDMQRLCAVLEELDPTNDPDAGSRALDAGSRASDFQIRHLPTRIASFESPAARALLSWLCECYLGATPIKFGVGEPSRNLV